MGLVYKAKDPMIDRIVAIKTIRQDSNLPARDAEEVKGWFQAGRRRLQGNSRIPVLLQYMMSVKRAASFYIVMETCRGRDAG